MLLANVQINYIYQAFTMHKHLQAECCQMFFCFFFWSIQSASIRQHVKLPGNHWVQNHLT